MLWAYATGVGHIAAGVAILTGVHARLAAIVLTAMFASFTPLVHVPMLLADPSSHRIWSENAVNLALIGAAWVVADSAVGSTGYRGALTAPCGGGRGPRAARAASAAMPAAARARASCEDTRTDPG